MKKIIVIIFSLTLLILSAPLTIQMVAEKVYEVRVG